MMNHTRSGAIDTLDVGRSPREDGSVYSSGSDGSAGGGGETGCFSAERREQLYYWRGVYCGWRMDSLGGLGWRSCPEGARDQICRGGQIRKALEADSFSSH